MVAWTSQKPKAYLGLVGSMTDIRVLDSVWVRKVTVEINGQQHVVELGPGEEWTCDIDLLRRLREIPLKELEAVRTRILASLVGTAALGGTELRSRRNDLKLRG